MATADQIIAYGLQEIGKPYVYGEEGPGAFDCSGLMQWIFGKAGIKLPRTAAEQQKSTTLLTSDPRPGDLVFYNSPATHVGLYLGNGRMLHSPNSRSKVKVADVYGNPTYGRVAGAGTGGVASGINTIANPITDVGNKIIDALADTGTTLMFAAGGAVLVLLGLWVTVRGKDRS